MKIYLAGRVTNADWREAIVDDMPPEPRVFYRDGWVRFTPRLDGIFKVHDCVGPFYVAHDTAVHYNDLADLVATKHRFGMELSHTVDAIQAEVNQACIKAIDACDLLFAWLDGPDLYGTLVEIGYARAAHKGMWIASSGFIDELWFAYHTAGLITTHFTRPRDALCALMLEAELSADGQVSYTDRPGFVYVLRAGSFYKIGRAKSIDARIKQISLQLPFPVELIHTIRARDYVALEQSLHRVFAGYRCNGEWFQLRQDDADWLCALGESPYIVASDRQTFIDRTLAPATLEL